MSEARSRPARWFGLGVLAGVLLALLVVGAAIAYVIGQVAGDVGRALQSDTRVEVRPAVADGRLELVLTYGRDVTGLVTTTVSDEAGQALWEVAGPGVTKPGVVVYGEVPADGPFKQTIPRDGSPPPDLRGKSVRVRVVSRFHVGLGPGQQVAEVGVDVPE